MYMRIEDMDQKELEMKIIKIIGIGKLSDMLPEPIEVIKECLKTDIYLNNIPLKKWDLYFKKLHPLINKAQKEIDPKYKGGVSYSDCTGLLKTVSKILVKLVKYKEHTVQCTDINGLVGDFYYEGVYPTNYIQISPTFKELIDLFNWKNDQI